MRKLFTSESVTEGHPDKIADQISDAVLDAILEQDPMGRVACETLVATGQIHVVGEISTNCYVDIPKIARETVVNIGYDRAKYGLPALKGNSQLNRLAENYAKDMIARGFFAHNNPEGQTPFDRMQAAGIGYRTAGENLAINSSVAAAETAFMNSSGHRANILSSGYTDVGIGVAQNSRGQLYVVQEFIGR